MSNAWYARPVLFVADIDADPDGNELYFPYPASLATSGDGMR